MLPIGTSCEQVCSHQASKLMNDRWASQVTGWQHEATEAVHAHLMATTIWPRLAPEERALIRSQGGPMSGVPFTCFPVSREARIESSSFRVLVLRRLWLPLPLSSRNCRCGLPLDPRGHHRVACAQVGVLGRRGFALESAAARLQGSWCQGVHKRDAPRLGPSSSGPPRYKTFGFCR